MAKAKPIHKQYMTEKGEKVYGMMAEFADPTAIIQAPRRSVTAATPSGTSTAPSPSTGWTRPWA